jgi:hypothetical protein
MNDDVKVTKCPPGEATGARDLQNWSRQRVVGGSGVNTSRREWKKLQRWEKPKLDAADRWLARHDPKKREG